MRNLLKVLLNEFTDNSEKDGKYFFINNYDWERKLFVTLYQ